MNEVLRTGSKSRLVVNLVFPEDCSYFEKYEFASAAANLTFLKSLTISNGSGCFYLKPDRREVTKQILSFYSDPSNIVMVFIIHKGDWFSCFRKGTEVQLDSDQIFVMPPLANCSNERDREKIVTRKIRDEINGIRATKVKDIFIVAFNRPGRPWFIEAMKQARKCDGATPLLEAVWNQLPGWEQATPAPECLSAFAILCQGYLAAYAEHCDGNVNGEVKKALEKMDWLNFRKEAPVEIKEKAKAGWHVEASGVQNPAWWAVPFHGESRQKKLPETIKEEWGPTENDADFLNIVTDFVEKIDAVNPIADPAEVARVFLAITNKLEGQV